MLAENGQIALDILNQKDNGISLVLLDVTIPVMSGVEVLARIGEVYPDLTVIVTSGFGEEQTWLQFKV